MVVRAKWYKSWKTDLAAIINESVISLEWKRASLIAQLVKNLCTMQDTPFLTPRFYSWVGKILWRRERVPLQYSWASLVAQLVNAGDAVSIPGLGRVPGEGKGYPLQYLGLENIRVHRNKSVKSPSIIWFSLVYSSIPFKCSSKICNAALCLYI